MKDYEITRPFGSGASCRISIASRYRGIFDKRGWQCWVSYGQRAGRMKMLVSTSEFVYDEATF